MEDLNEQARVRWRCRRGMLELDLVLIPFAEREYPLLSGAQRAAFRRLLNYPDPWLLEALAGQRQNDDPVLRDIIGRIRQTSEN